MKTLYIISKGLKKISDEEIVQKEKEDLHPRVSLLENELSADLLDERYLYQMTPYWRRWLYKLLPVVLAQILEGLFLQRNYSVVFSQSEKVGLPLAFVRKIFSLKTPHVVIISRITSRNPKKSRKKKKLLKYTQDAIDRILIWSSVQRKLAIEELGVPESKIKLLKRGTDQKFWRPIRRESDMICSVGMEMRDYPTLVEALRPLDIPCHIAAGATRGELFKTVKRLYKIKDLPEDITVGRKPYAELRSLYARCRFTVIPLLPTDSDNGLTALLESMAMGKPVICSRTDGQVDVIQDGVTGILVPQGDPQAMREAIVELWNNPERARAMGKAAREYVEDHHNVEQFVKGIKNEILDVVGGKAKAEPAYKKKERVEA